MTLRSKYGGRVEIPVFQKAKMDFEFVGSSGDVRTEGSESVGSMGGSGSRVGGNVPRIGGYLAIANNVDIV